MSDVATLDPKPLRLGLAPKVDDIRTLRYAVLRAPGAWRPPLSWRFDREHAAAGIPLPMFANDTYGDCVIACRAHATLRFEWIEQGRVLPITDTEVTTEYFTESGGFDHGLVMLFSLRDWRNKGWVAGGSRYFCHSFLAVNPADRNEVAEAAIVGNGLNIGLRLPLSASDQMNAGQAWDVVADPRDPRGWKDSWGGHCVLLNGYDQDGVDLVTWGRPQRATWAFFAAYCDEAYVVIDDINRPAVRRGLDFVALHRALGVL